MQPSPVTVLAGAPATIASAPPVWVLQKGLDVVTCRMTTADGQIAIRAEIDSSGISMVILQQCDSVETARSLAAMWRILLREGGWTEPPPPVQARRKPDRRASTSAAAVISDQTAAAMPCPQPL